MHDTMKLSPRFMDISKITDFNSNSNYSEGTFININAIDHITKIYTFKKPTIQRKTYKILWFNVSINVEIEEEWYAFNVVTVAGRVYPLEAHTHNEIKNMVRDLFSLIYSATDY